MNARRVQTSAEHVRIDFPNNSGCVLCREGNTDPRKAYRQQAAVELSAQGFVWLNDRLEKAFAQHGKLAPDVLEQLDWPTIPTTPGPSRR
jgi:hypothetical protein